MKCRHCCHELTYEWLDLGFAPPSNAYIAKEDLCSPELHFPLRLYVCKRCWLVQTEDYAQADALFSPTYAYFSSVSKSWLQHAENYCRMIIKRLALDKNSHVIEVAANDGYLLKNMITAGIPCLGIEPTQSTARVAESLGIPVITEFFGKLLGKRLADTSRKADLIIGNNVLAHVPDINDFVKGLKLSLKMGGTITLEFPHLLKLIQHCQFDTIYHEHYSYLSLYTVSEILNRNDLKVYDVELLSTHGGSLRVYACHEEDSKKKSALVDEVLEQEVKAGLQSLKGFIGFQEKALKIKLDLLSFLLEQKLLGKQVVGYGAAAKGNTLLNYSGVDADLLPFIVDASVHKQGLFMPGSHIPIVHEAQLKQVRPDFVLILPWNLREEIAMQLGYISDWGGRFVVSIPNMEIF
ncbi:MAG: SAM-dependent methyltransferase [Gammaproteobacteria bacterium CG22_combo_CG10-13_8_21_14_all_40_8]|nr:MAG: SAM-dependent methyltransferase [Gammaproteobacteria bacterium CG22_combo_CG10-13_8_21_14_all_40_8]